MSVEVQPTYASIACVVDLCEPWIEIWSGDEWGESMDALARACHTDYGFSDEDCALFASKLFENLEAQKDWVLAEGYQYDFWEEDRVSAAEEKCRELREYWKKGGNLTDWEPAIQAANETLKVIPGWVFGEPRPKLQDE